jgi:hypothetical protein
MQTTNNLMKERMTQNSPGHKGSNCSLKILNSFLRRAGCAGGQAPYCSFSTLHPISHAGSWRHQPIKPCRLRTHRGSRLSPACSIEHLSPSEVLVNRHCTKYGCSMLAFQTLLTASPLRQEEWSSLRESRVDPQAAVGTPSQSSRRHVHGLLCMVARL